MGLSALTQMVVKAEQVPGDITDDSYLVQDIKGTFFFFHLLGQPFL